MSFVVDLCAAQLKKRKKKHDKNKKPKPNKTFVNFDSIRAAVHDIS